MVFLAGSASGTVANSMSAYDMEVSDAIYGSSGRYVSRERLRQMPDQEFEALVSRLGPSRGKRSTFFSIADTVSTGNKRRGQSGRGWIGIRFSSTPHAPSLPRSFCTPGCTRRISRGNRRRSAFSA